MRKNVLITVLATLVLSVLLIISCKPSVQDSPVLTNGQETQNLTQVSLYFSKNKGSEVLSEAVIRTVPSSEKNSPLAFALYELLRGPTDEESAQGFFSEIPKGTRLLGINPSGKSLRVNLSKQFTSGGGSNSMTERVNELTQTIRSIEKARPVYVDIEGQELKVLGGEGLDVDEPINTAASP